ncbi:probable low-affinity inorganic phosphate transporter, partial [Arthrobacter sp. Hiyo6]
AAVLVLALLAAGLSDGGSLPPWVPLLTAAMLTAGTLAGGWRISYTVGYKLTRIDPLRGFVAQMYSSLILLLGAIGLHWPISTTHTVTAAVLGAGTNQNFPATNRRLVIRILAFWVLTPPRRPRPLLCWSWRSRPWPGCSRHGPGPGVRLGRFLSEAAGNVIFRGLLGGIAEDCVGVAHFDQLSGFARSGDVEERGPVRDARGLLHVVGNDHHGVLVL